MKNKAASNEDDWLLGQIKQQPSRIQAAHIGRPVRQLLSRYGITQTQAAHDLAEAWKQAAGPQTGKCYTHWQHQPRRVIDIYAKQFRPTRTPFATSANFISSQSIFTSRDH